MGLYLFFIFFLGLFFGSFLNVLADRLPRNEKITGRSQCENCHKTLSWKDLIPVISFVYLRGRCRYCGSKLSLQYPIVEILTGTLFAFTIYNLPFTSPVTNHLISSIYYLIMVSSLIVVFFADLKYGIIPDKIVLPAIFVSFLFLMINHQSLIINHLFSAFGWFGFMLFLFLATKGRGMGMGDVKLSFLIGLFLGSTSSIFAFYLSFLTGGAVSLILILWKKKTLKSTIPFGPFLVIGSLLALFLKII